MYKKIMSINDDLNNILWRTKQLKLREQYYNFIYLNVRILSCELISSIQFTEVNRGESNPKYNLTLKPTLRPTYKYNLLHHDTF